MPSRSLRVILAAALSCCVVGCKQEQTEPSDKKVFAPEIEAMRPCLHRDGILTRALETYRFGIGSYPTTKQGLKALLSRPKGLDDPKAWQGPYLDDEKCLTDSWQNEFIYTFPGKTHDNRYDIVSMGPDGQKGTEDDVLNWNIR